LTGALGGAKLARRANERDLRDEVKSTIASRNAAFLAFAGAAIAAVVKIFPLHHLSSFSSRLVAIGLLPMLYFGIAVLQVGAMARTSRAGLVVAVVEEKVRLLFADSSLADAKLIPELARLNLNLTGCSATILFKRAFSCSSAFSRCASSSFSAPYLIRQR
jgi:hypothetical protein